MLWFCTYFITLHFIVFVQHCMRFLLFCRYTYYTAFPIFRQRNRICNNILLYKADIQKQKQHSYHFTLFIQLSFVVLTFSLLCRYLYYKVSFLYTQEGFLRFPNRQKHKKTSQTFWSISKKSDIIRFSNRTIVRL